MVDGTLRIFFGVVGFGLQASTQFPLLDMDRCFCLFFLRGLFFFLASGLVTRRGGVLPLRHVGALVPGPALRGGLPASQLSERLANGPGRAGEAAVQSGWWQLGFSGWGGVDGRIFFFFFGIWWFSG